MKTFQQFLESAANAIKPLYPYKTMNQGTYKDGNFRYIKRLFKQVKSKQLSNVA